MTGDLERSYAQSNRELLEAFSTYLISLNRSTATRRAYLDAVERLIEILGPKDAADLDRSDIRQLQTQLIAKGISESSIHLHVGGIRAVAKFLRLAGVTKHDPTLLLAQRKLPTRVPRVLTVKEIERLIAAAQTPLEKAVIEVLYATGVRVSEFVRLRVEDITFSDPGVIRVNRGKGDKDYVVLFGQNAAAAIEAYLNGRKAGFLFEAEGHPYNARSIREILARVAFRANITGVHPHAFRRALASHMLEDGADLRAIQDLLGHQNITSTMYYTHLTARNLKAVYDRCHAHAKGDEDGGEK